jgi:subtilisin family serine protease
MIFSHKLRRCAPFFIAAILSVLAYGTFAQEDTLGTFVQEDALGTFAQEDAPVAAAGTTTRVIVAFKPNATSAVKQAVASVLDNYGQQEAEIALAEAEITELPSAALAAIVVELPKAELDGLSHNPNIAFIEEDLKRYPLALTTPSEPPYSPGQDVPYGIQMVQADLLFDTDASNQKICIIDTGYNFYHEDLPFEKVTWDDVGLGSWKDDAVGHGTHVAGIIAALDNESTGVVGVHSNDSLQLHIINVGSSGFYASDIVNAAFRCAYAGANVINMSLGGPRFSKWESMAFDVIYKDFNTLIVAAAGNSGNSVPSYPAAYASVVSVGAVDEKRRVASFSTFNYDVELAGPGVDVFSTMPEGMGNINELSVDDIIYTPRSMLGSARATATGELADFGIGDEFDDSVEGKVCLIARGLIPDMVKISNCKDSGGVAAVIYNNKAGGFTGRLPPDDETIPSLTVSKVDGAALKNQLGMLATVTVSPSDYEYLSGTSMAAPHVSAVAALVWARNPGCTAARIRASLAKSARDLGAMGRDKYYGFGLVQAKAADDRIKSRGCGK